jgi:hypothetical protein
VANTRSHNPRVYPDIDKGGRGGMSKT